MTEEHHSPLPWELIAGTDHHGAYIVSAAGLDVCDLYAMSNPMAASIRNGGDSKPVPFRDMDANARMIVQAVNGADLVRSLWEDDRIRLNVRKDYPELAAAIDKMVGGLPS